MTVKQLMEALQQHNPEAEVHVANDRGYYEYVGCPSCVDDEAFHEAWQESLEGLPDEEYDAAIDGEWPEPPICNGTCKDNPVVVMWVD